MISNRQLDILRTFYQNSDTYIKLKDIAQKNHISVRTVQAQISQLRDMLANSGMSLCSVPSKGYILHVEDPEKAKAFIQGSMRMLSFDTQAARVSYILKSLLSTDGYLKSQDLADSIFISRSRLSDDMVLVKKILADYNLSLISKPYHGLKISGTESNIRQCMIYLSESLQMDDLSQGDQALTLRIRQIIPPILSETNYHISDQALQSLLSYILIAVKRIQEGHIVESVFPPNRHLYSGVYKTAQKVMSLCHDNFHIPLYESEIWALAVNLHGKQEYTEQNTVPADIKDMIRHGLEHIKQDYNIDFTNDSELQTALELHMVPLLSRLQSNMPVKNMLLNDVKINYTLAFDIATTFLSALSGDNLQISEDEISYFALHFSYALLNQDRGSLSKKVLLVGSDRKSMLILVSQKIRQWFVEIQNISILPSNEVTNENIRQYDLVLSTDKEIVGRYPQAKLISQFLGEKYYKRIELALSGFNNLQDILDNFDRDLFYYGEAKDKYDIINILYKKASQKYTLDQEFLSSLMEHENNSNSQFGEFLAIPHPERPVSTHTFIAVGILKDEIPWSENFYVRLVFLVSIGKGNPKALKLWYYLSPLISDQSALLSIVDTPSYENMIRVIKKVYHDLF